MEITVNVDKIDLGDYIGSHYDEDGDRVPAGTLGDAITRQLVERFARSDTYKGLAGRVQAIRDEEIHAQIAPIVTEALTQPVQRTNSYGERCGETTMRELIVAEAKRYLSEPSDSYSRDKGTRLQAEVRKAVDSAFKDEIVAAVKQARDAVAAELGSTVTEMVAAAVQQALAKR